MADITDYRHTGVHPYSKIVRRKCVWCGERSFESVSISDVLAQLEPYLDRVITKTRSWGDRARQGINGPNSGPFVYSD